MGRYCRRGYTAAGKRELWDRWSQGESLNSIGRAFGKPSSSIYGHISPYGGIRPKPPHRSKLALTLAEREEISRGLVADYSLREIAKSLGLSPSTVSREITRNGDQAITGLFKPIRMPGINPSVPRPVNWHVIERCAIR